MTQSNKLSITYVPLDQIIPSPMNPRKHFDANDLEELAASIKENGVLQPITVREHPDKTLQLYEIVAGERRYRASISAGIETIPAILRDLTDVEALKIMIIENLQRKDIHPMEEAAGFAQLIEVQGMDIKEIAARVGKHPSFVAKRLKLANLIEPIQEVFYKGYLLVKDAITLSQLRPDDQEEFYQTNLEGIDEVYDLTEWELSKFQHRLDDASFDITDASLVPGKPACTVCPYNSVSALLFANHNSRAMCNNPECYRQKCDAGFERSLAQARADQDTVLITGQPYAYQTIGKELKEMMESDSSILTRNDYVEIEQPEKPDPDDYADGPDSIETYNDDLKQYTTELASFKKKIASGEYRRALKVGGDDKGSFTYVKLINADRGVKIQPAAPIKEDTPEYIRQQIEEIKQNELDKKSGDPGRLRHKLAELWEPAQYMGKMSGTKLSVTEINAVAEAIANTLGDEDEFRLEFFGAIDEDRLPAGFTKSPNLLSSMLRYFFVNQLNVRWRDEGIGIECLREHLSEEVAAAEAEMAKEIADREAEVAKKLKTLQAKLKSLQADKAPKKGRGKGIKALIPDKAGK